MTNFEKYKDVILEISKNGDRVAVDRRTKKVQSCSDVTCWNCVFYNGDASCSAPSILWLYEEYQEQKVDWSKVPVDTKILVSQDGDRWLKGHFAKYEDDEVCAWGKGQTSWTSTIQIAWKYAKLAEGAE